MGSMIQTAISLTSLVILPKVPHTKASDATSQSDAGQYLLKSAAYFMTATRLDSSQAPVMHQGFGDEAMGKAALLQWSGTTDTDICGAGEPARHSCI